MSITVQETSRASLGELAGLAIEQDLVKYCCIAKESVGLTLEGLELRLPPEEARELLRLILRGSAFQKVQPAAAGEPEPESTPEPESAPPPAAEPKPAEGGTRPTMIIRGAEAKAESDAESAETYQKRESFRAPSVLASSETVRSATSAAERSGVGGDGDQYEEEISEEYLDSVLSFALSMGIIEGYTKDREAHAVTLRTGATTTGLSYWETLEYLTNSMLYELRPKSER